MMVNAKSTHGDPNTQYNNTVFNTYCTVQLCHIQVNENLQLQQYMYILRVQLPSMHHHYIAADTAPTIATPIIENGSTTCLYG